MIASQYRVTSKSEQLAPVCGGSHSIRFAVGLTSLDGDAQATINFVSDNPNAAARYRVGEVVDVSVSPACVKS